MSPLNVQVNELGCGLTSLTFEEFSWKDENGGYRLVSVANILKLREYMKTHYPEVTSVDEVSPYVVMWCSETTPKPFLIGGALGIWLVDGQYPPSGITGGFVGNFRIQLEVDDYYVEDIRPYHIPKADTFRHLMREAFPDALAISFVGNEIIVSLPELTRHEFANRLQTLPGSFAHDRSKIFYHNGLRTTAQPNKQLGQLKSQAREGKPLHSDELTMDGIYMIDNDGTGCHGAMLCKGKTVISQTDQVVLGIFATSDCAAYGDPDIRARCSGSALVRLEKSTEAEGGSEKSGGVGGFIVGLEFEGERGSDSTPRLLCYAEVNDGVIEAGGEGA